MAKKTKNWDFLYTYVLLLLLVFCYFLLNYNYFEMPILSRNNKQKNTIPLQIDLPCHIRSTVLCKSGNFGLNRNLSSALKTTIGRFHN